MKYTREDFIQELGKIEGTTIRETPTEEGNDEVTFEWKNSVFLLSTQTSEQNKNISIIGLHYIYRPAGIMDEISTLDKYRIANFLTAESKYNVSATYREQSDSFQISSKYDPILENLDSFKSTTDKEYKKNIRYIILSLMSKCFIMSSALAGLTAEFIEESDELLEKLKGR